MRKTFLLLAACLFTTIASAPTTASAQDAGITCAILRAEAQTLRDFLFRNIAEMQDKLRRMEELDARLDGLASGIKRAATTPKPAELTSFEDFDFNVLLMLNLSDIADWERQIAVLADEADAARKRAFTYRDILVKVDGLANNICAVGGGNQTVDRKGGRNGAGAGGADVVTVVSNPDRVTPVGGASVCNALVPYVSGPITEANLNGFLTAADSCGRTSGSPTVLYHVCYCSDFQGEPCPSRSSGYGYCKLAIPPQTLARRVGGIFKNTAEACAARGPSSVYCDPIKVVMMPYPPGTPAHEIPGPPRWND